MTNFEGKYCWVDLTTTDIEASKKFYGELFGWSFREDQTHEKASYWTACVGDKTVAGLTSQATSQRVASSTWNTYFSVKNLESFSDKAHQFGAKTLVSRQKVGAYGSLSVLQDPAGAYFCTWESSGDPNVEGDYSAQKPGFMTWTELLTRDVDRAGKFYSEAFDFTPEATNAGEGSQPYILFKHDQKPQAGMAPMPEKLAEQMSSYWMNYVFVENCNRSLEKATQMGAKTLVEASDIPNMGRFATIQDPQGAVISIFSE